MLLRKINKKLFKICDIIFPAYYSSKIGNKLKNCFGKRCFNKVGKNVNWGKKLQLTYNFSIGDNSGVGDNAKIEENVSIGNYVMMGKNVTIITKNHKIDRTDIPMCKQGFTEIKELIIEDDVWICDNVFITPGVHKIGQGSVLAGGSVVTKDVEPFTIVAGNPAKVIKRRK